MSRSLQGTAARTALWAVILLLHAALLIGFLRAGLRSPHHEAPLQARRPVHIMLSPPAMPPDHAGDGGSARTTLSPVPAVPPSAVPVDAPAPPLLAPPPADAPAAPRVDWQREAEAVADAIASRRPQPEEADRFGAPPKTVRQPCTPRPSSFKWNPEEKRAGFSGGLPYVRLGERCVLGLGFFGCALGQLPEVNGKLFDDLKDPDYVGQESSVPDPNYCD